MPLIVSHNRCRYYWGSHGCYLENGHQDVHHCGGDDWKANPLDDDEWPCSEYDEATGNAHYGLIDEQKWGEWNYHGAGWMMSD